MRSTSEPREPEVREALDQRFAAFVKAYEDRDLAALQDLFWHDDELVFVGTQANLHFIGWPLIERSFRRQFEALRDLRLTVRSPLHWHGAAPASTLACLTVPALDLALTAGARSTLHRGIRLTCVFERRGTQWRIVQMHWSTANPEVVVDHD
jgi:ketosteroid isomerase-like protein